MPLLPVTVTTPKRSPPPLLCPKVSQGSRTLLCFFFFPIDAIFNMDSPPSLKFPLQEFPQWLSRLRTQLVSMRMQVQSLAPLSGLRIRHCCGTGCRYGSDPTLLWLWLWAGSYSSDSTPSLGTSICHRYDTKKQKKKKKKDKNTTATTA